MKPAATPRAFVTAVLLCALGAACSAPSEPLKVTAIDLGIAVDNQNRVQSPSMTFSPESAVYASIATEGSGTGTLAGRWTDSDGRFLNEQTQTINPTKPAYFEFHFVPPGGWPKGRHKVVFTLDGGGTRTREFEVR